MQTPQLPPPTQGVPQTLKIEYVDVKNRPVAPKSGTVEPMNGSKPSSRIDPHSALAEKLYGEVTPTGRAKAKEINYMRAYSAGEIAVGRKAGQFPSPTSHPLN